MSKEGDLWDDSALINAFDHAMSKYKKMHGKKKQDDSTDAGDFVDGMVGDSLAGNESPEPVREDGENNNISLPTTELGENRNVARMTENHHVDSSESGLDKQAYTGYSYPQVTEDYNQLLGQYYELEEKRQMILKQLDQLGNYNYQYPFEDSRSGAQQGTCFTTQDHLVLPSQAYTTTCWCSCCPYACNCCVAPCSSLPTCSLSSGEAATHKACNNSCGVLGPGKEIPSSDGDIVKTAMRAAENAISSMKLKAAANSEEENRENNGREMAQSTSYETDLGLVLNAWYSAGFYTGKYLTEQRITKRQD